MAAAFIMSPLSHVFFTVLPYFYAESMLFVVQPLTSVCISCRIPNLWLIYNLLHFMEVADLAICLIKEFQVLDMVYQ